MELSEENNKAVEYLCVNNNIQYNLLKAAEECQELSLILTQRVTKPDRVEEEEVTDEIGDVFIRLHILNKMLPNEYITCNEHGI